jgi:hypothetical protein
MDEGQQLPLVFLPEVGVFAQKGLDYSFVFLRLQAAGAIDQRASWANKPRCLIEEISLSGLESG